MSGFYNCMIMGAKANEKKKNCGGPFPPPELHSEKNQNSMYWGTLIWRKIKIPCTRPGTWIWRKNKISCTRYMDLKKKQNLSTTSNNLRTTRAQIFKAKNRVLLPFLICTYLSLVFIYFQCLLWKCIFHLYIHKTKILV